MRTSLLLLSTAFVLSACADDQTTTAPGNTRRVPSSAASAAVDPGAAAPINQGKPNQPAFTLSSVKSMPVTLGTSGSVTATCPAGTQVVGGGYAVTGSVGNFALDTNGPNASNGWSVHGSLDVMGSSVTITVTAICIQ